jgi:protein tyrosine phosphatase type 4A
VVPHSHQKEMFYEDGQSPPPEVISRWLDLVSKTFDSAGAKDAKPCIAVHCVAGLGRAPVLVAIALVEYGLDAGSAVSFIRDRRRGAINAVQLSYLQGYRKQRSSGGKCCIA